MTRASRGSLLAGACALAGAALTACGSATATVHAGSSATAASSCAATIAGTVEGVAARIYHEAATGEDAAQAVHRIRNSQALVRTVDAGNARAASAALRALALGQIVRAQVLLDGRVLASAGSAPAIAPVRGSIPGTHATFVLSVQSDHNYVQVARQVTGAQLELSDAADRWIAGTVFSPSPAEVPDAGTVASAGLSYQVASLPAMAFPSGAVRIATLVPAREISCPGPPAQARVETLGHVGERIYGEELASAQVASTLRMMERAPFFRRAVAERSVAATRAAIVRFFEAHIHVVRVRVTVGGRVLIDLGGPDVLAPVQGTLRVRGVVVGQFAMAVQDDAGYLKLARLFTGADVLMRRSGTQVAGTLTPGPASVPERGALDYGGRSYEAYSFTAEAFPAGPLRISLLLGA